jgi:hypothetical protein
MEKEELYKIKLREMILSPTSDPPHPFPRPSEKRAVMTYSLSSLIVFLFAE